MTTHLNVGYPQNLTDDELDREWQEVHREYAEASRIYNSFDYWSDKEFEEWEHELANWQTLLDKLSEEIERRSGARHE